MRSLSLLLLLLAGAFPAFGQSGRPLPTPTDLALVPPDCVMFAHVKVGDLWKNDALADLRMILGKAGAQAVDDFDRRFGGLPMGLERVTAFLPHFHRGLLERVEPVVIFTTKKPIDKAAFLKLAMPKHEEKKGKFGPYYIEDDGGLSLKVVDATTYVLGTEDQIALLNPAATTRKAGPLSPAIQAAIGNRPVVVGINTASLPPEGLESLKMQVPPAMHPLLEVQSIVATLDLEGDGKIHAKFHYAKASDTDDAEKALVAAADLGLDLIDKARRQLNEQIAGKKEAKLEDLPESALMLLGLGALQHAEDVIKSKPVKREGDALAAVIPLPPYAKTVLGTGAYAASMMTPAIGKMRQAAYKAQTQNNLKQIGIALHTYHDALGTFPPAAVVDKKAKPQLSWRVMILPFIEQDALYREFKLDEPWDSDHNKTLIEKMPRTYMLPNGKSKPGMTHYRGFVGNDAFWDPVQGAKIQTITDGTSNTWMVVEAEEGVPWSKPDDLPFDPTKDLPALGKFWKGGFNVLLCDGSVRYFPAVPKMAKAMITRSGGEVIQFDE
jgi:Protein of unknown function (DUF1559)